MTRTGSGKTNTKNHGILSCMVFLAILSFAITDDARCADNMKHSDSLAGPGIPHDRHDAGWSVQIDNDSLNGSSRDHDYTGGIAIAFYGSRVEDFAITVSPILNWLDRFSAIHRTRHGKLLPGSVAMQIGLIAFTPDQLDASTPLLGDRPYANLVFLTSSRFSVDVVRSVAHQSHLTVGVLGTPAVAWLQDGIHELFDSTRPMGYEFQISKGGELTARYALSRQSLISTGYAYGRRFEVTHSTELSIGYLTETSVSVSARLGRFSSPWWTFSPERAAYIQQPGPSDLQSNSRRQGSERYVWAGLSLRARIYNSFLQGQFRDSAVTVPGNRLRILIPEFSVGLSTSLADRWQLTYSLRFQGQEIRSGPAARGMIWAGIGLRRY